MDDEFVLVTHTDLSFCLKYRYLLVCHTIMYSCSRRLFFDVKSGDFGIHGSRRKTSAQDAGAEYCMKQLLCTHLTCSLSHQSPVLERISRRNEETAYCDELVT